MGSKGGRAQRGPLLSRVARWWSRFLGLGPDDRWAAYRQIRRSPGRTARVRERRVDRLLFERQRHVKLGSQQAYDRLIRRLRKRREPPG